MCVFWTTLYFQCSKKLHLVKPFVLCTSDGYIVDIYGLNPAFKKDNDLIYNENSAEESES